MRCTPGEPEGPALCITALRLLVVPGTGAEPPGGCVAVESKLPTAEFPTVTMSVEPDDGRIPVTVPLDRWFDEAMDFARFDAVVDDLVASGRTCLVIAGTSSALTQAAWQMLCRWQRHLDRRNEASRSRAFDALLSRFRAAHDLSKPLVRADWNHALDTWQWMLRLDANASAGAQMAALLHDVERLESEADRRVEHLAPDYARFKTAHAHRGASIARAMLEASEVDASTRERVVKLVTNHERPTEDPDCALLNDADALSFFSQNSAGYRDYFGAAQTARKIAYSLARMRSASVARLARVRLRADVRAILQSVVGEGPIA